MTCNHHQVINTYQLNQCLLTTDGVMTVVGGDGVTVGVVETYGVVVVVVTDGDGDGLGDGVGDGVGEGVGDGLGT